jgi:hypothetical protein
LIISHGSQLNVTDSFLPDDPEKAVEEFFRLVRKRMIAEQIAKKDTKVKVQYSSELGIGAVLQAAKSRKAKQIFSLIKFS